MPRSFWEAGDRNSNLIETVHSDVNREGVHCTLVGGIKKAHHFDTMKLKTLGVGFDCSNQNLTYLFNQAFEAYGITPTYRTGHLSENAVINLKRRGDFF